MLDACRAFLYATSRLMTADNAATLFATDNAMTPLIRHTTSTMLPRYADVDEP